MSDFLSSLNLHDLNLYSIILRSVMAIIFGALFGIERSLKNRPAGVRTYILVCLASAGVMMTNIYIAGLYPSVDPTRMSAQVISGIGFLGAGTILVTRTNEVKGLTTAAGLWTSAVMGLVIGVGFYSAAIVLSISVFIIMSQFKKVKSKITEKTRFVHGFYHFEDKKALEDFLLFAARNHWQINSLQKFDKDTFEDKEAYHITIKLPEAYPTQVFLEEVELLDGILTFEEI